MKKILALFLVLNLAACSTVSDKFNEIKTGISQVVTPDNFDTITVLYTGVSAIGDGYYSLCERKVINKSCWKIIAKVQPYENKAFDAYMALDEFVKNNPTSDATSLITLAKNAISALKNIQIQNGVK